MISAGNITGEISIAIDGHEHRAIARFEVPVSITADPEVEGGYVLNAAPHQTIIEAAAGALTEAATQLLASIPSADITDH